MLRRTLLGASVFVLLANLAVVTTGSAAPAPGVQVAAAAPVGGLLPAEPIPEMAPPTFVPSTTTTIAEPPSTQPIDPPENAYAAEPHVVIGQIQVPKLGLDVPLNEGISLRSIDHGPSHWPGTAMPGQSSGNVVVAGHRVTHTKPFRHLDTLAPGDEIIFIVDGVRSVYHVTGSEVVTPDRTDIVVQTAEPIVTLFACHPPGSARYRYVVRGALVSSSPA
jgi:sortase A